MSVRGPLSKVVAVVLCYGLALHVLLAAFEMARAGDLVSEAAPILCGAKAAAGSEEPHDRSRPIGHTCPLCPMPMCGLAPLPRESLGTIGPRRYAVERPPERCAGLLAQHLRSEAHAPRAPPALT